MITLPSNYGLPMLSAIVLAFECVLTGFFVAGRARSKVFTKEFLKTNFDQIHFSELDKEDISGQMGYPDMGSGRYSEKLPYADWVFFNRAQRVHYNFLEQLTPSILFILVAGIEFPQAACGIGFGLVFARICFVFYLSKGGPTHPLRGLGAILGDLGMLGAFVLSCITCARHIE